MNTNIIGNQSSLFSMHGEVDVKKALEALICMSELDEIDINFVNDKSESGGIFVEANGNILETFDKSAEMRARYKIVPTGLKLRYTEYPLFASFIKINNFWEGAFIGTGVQLFDMYKQHYKGKSENFINDYRSIFGSENRTVDITGFGLTEITNNIEEDKVYSDSEQNNVVTELSLALERLEKQNSTDTNKSKNKKAAHLSKAQRKAERLKAHLDKMKAKEERLEQEKKQEEANKEKDNNDVEWLEPTMDCDTYFQDNVTKEFNGKIQDYINGDSKYDEYDKEENETYEVDDESEHTCNELETIEEMDHDKVTETSYKMDKFKLQLKIDLIHDIYERLLIKENWESTNKNRLGFYLKGICLIIWQEQQNHDNSTLRGNGYTYSENKQKCVINTNLLDSYGNSIYLVDHTPLLPNFYDKKITLLTNKSALLAWGFNIKDVRKLPEPLVIIPDTHKLLFSADLDDFDLDDTLHLKHIIEERRERFPKKYKEESSISLCEKIKSSIVQAIKISKTDYRYIIPKYDFLRQDIQFLIPLYLDNSLDDSPELTIVVGKTNELWTIYTVLYTDDAYDDARLLCKPNDSWININKRKSKEDKE